MSYLPDPRFFRLALELDAKAGAALCSGRLTRGGDDRLTAVAEVTTGGEGALAFAEKNVAEAAAVAVIIVPSGATDEVPKAIPSVIEADDPRLAYALLATAIFKSRFEQPSDDDKSEPQIHAEATVADAAYVGPGAVIDAGAVISPTAVVGHGVVIGSGTYVGPGASVTHAVVGAGCRIAAGARIGESGFGYAASPQGPVLLPQLGIVELHDGVDIGANAAVDRGMLDNTVIGRFSKIDNLCQIGHNCKLGQAVVAASQTGISGSCDIGDGVMMGGQVGLADHLTIGSGALLAAKSGFMKDVEPGAKMGGYPAKPLRQWMKETAALTRLAGKKK